MVSPGLHDVSHVQTDRWSEGVGASLRELLPYTRMEEISKGRREEYAKAQPYPHIVIDGFFDEWILDTILEEFPRPGDKN